jgi:hypothetical protein
MTPLEWSDRDCPGMKRKAYEAEDADGIGFEIEPEYSRFRGAYYRATMSAGTVEIVCECSDVAEAKLELECWREALVHWNELVREALARKRREREAAT